MAAIKYKYALNEQGRVVSIRQAFLERNDNHKYFCLGCGSKMIPRLGDVRTWHFAHSGDDVSCSQETYIHKLAKRLIKDKFERESSFEVGYYKEKKCSDIQSCPFAKSEECKAYELETFDLKKYYDTCDEEKQIGEYVADLLFTLSSKPERDPILIEIFVSHECTQQKKKSGHRIIEIHLKTEEDILKLLSAPIVENPNRNLGHHEGVDTIGFAKFYNFKKQTLASERLGLRSIPRFYLFSSGKAYVSNMDEFKSCQKVNIKDNDKAIFEVSFDSSYLGEHSIYEYGYALAQQMGIQLKTCHFCKFHRNGYDRPLGLSPIFCCLHKKLGTPEYPESQYANVCEYYREIEGLLDEIRKTYPKMHIATNC